MKNTFYYKRKKVGKKCKDTNFTDKVRKLSEKGKRSQEVGKHKKIDSSLNCLEETQSCQHLDFRSDLKHSNIMNV